MKVIRPLRRVCITSAFFFLFASTHITEAIDAPLKTEWTDDVNASPVPLSEYPRPQRVRRDWQNLNGQWDYFGGISQVDPTNPPGTPPDFPANPDQIKVPFPPESYLSGIMRNLEINMWYRRTFTDPNEWVSCRVLLNFEVVAETASVYVNGKLAGQHTGRWESFTLEITDLLVSGDNTVIVGANDPHDGKTSCGKDVISLGDYTFTSGIWQTVWLEPVPESYLSQLSLTISLEDSSVSITAIADGAETSISVSVSGDGKVIDTGAGGNGTGIVVYVPKPRLLDESGAVIDQVTSYFGMRSIALGSAGGSLHPLLNGQFVFQLGPLDQGYWPDGIHTAPTDDAIQKDLKTLKDLGFNMVRKHAKVEPQRWYYWADKFGLLVWQDMPSVWYPDNDTASLDPTRPVDGNSGYNNTPGYRPAPGDPGNGDFDDLHIYIGPDGAPKPSSTRAAASGEFGGVGLQVNGSMWPGNHTAYEMQFSVDALTDRLVELLLYSSDRA